jgi:hypothetical protein
MARIIVTIVFCSLVFFLFALNGNSTASLDFYFYKFESVSSMVIGAGGFLLGALFTLILVVTRKIARGLRTRGRREGKNEAAIPQTEAGPEARHPVPGEADRK